MNCQSIGLLGFGAFGRLAAEHLAPLFEVRVCDPAAQETDIRTLGARPASIAEIGSSDVCILAVPVQAIETASAELAPVLRPGTLVADVASIKLGPIEAMRRVLPTHVELLGTHPLFGPQTVAEVGLKGQSIALCPVRLGSERLALVHELLVGSLGLNIVECTPEEHDRQMAIVQVITHLIGHAAREMDLPDLPLATLAYKRLMQMKRNTEADSPQLFEAIQTLNPFAAEARCRFFEAVRAIERTFSIEPPELR
ncbi:MAG: prephenate dehydrogenase [Planctomycetota bacterium]|nr:MAG: prephenate dehydrogenase [Planctomycetota bacterium]